MKKIIRYCIFIFCCLFAVNSANAQELYSSISKSPIDSYRTQVKQIVLKNISNQRRHFNEYGEVYFTIDKDGSPSGVEILTSTGDSKNDQLISKAISNSVCPKPPASFDEEDLTFRYKVRNVKTEHAPYTLYSFPFLEKFLVYDSVVATANMVLNIILLTKI